LMARYRKKPVEIEAVQLRWDTWDEMCSFAGVGPEEDKPEGCYIDAEGYTHDAPPSNDALLGLRIPTLEGTMLATEGDWVIKGIQGELYPCKPEIFEATYEQVEEREAV
jgi:hypothetical protein